MLKNLSHLLYIAVIMVFIPFLTKGQTITDFSPTSLSAGTNNILTINGSGFGTGPSTGNYVQFRSADDGGVSYFSPINTDYISWTNTKITLKVPSKAATGNIRVVINSIGINSSSNLTIKYNLLNSVGPDGNSVQSKKINHNGSGGYTFRFNTAFNATTDAGASFTRAINSWKCATNINWSIGTSTTINADASDGVNIVKFGTEDEIEVGTLAYCRTYSRRCGTGNWESVEIDFVVNNKDYTWNYSTSAPSNNAFDFESVALHELGHAHSLGHVNNTADVMHYAVSRGTMKRTLNSFNTEAGLLAMSYAVTTESVCYPPMIALTNGCANKTNQTLSAPNWQNRTFGEVDFDHTITASSGLPVTLTSSNTAVATIVGNKIHIFAAGSTTITASQAGNAIFNPAPNLTLSLTVNKAPQTITFPTILTIGVNSPDFDPLAISSSGLGVVYTTNNPSVATIVGGKIHIVGVGSVTITASQSGNTNYNAAISVSKTFAVAGQLQTIKFNPLINKVVGDPDFEIGATTSSGLPVSYTSSNPAVAILVGTKIRILAAGTTTITASQSGNAVYAPAPNVSQSLTVNKFQQEILSFNALPSKTYGDPDFEIGATASSGLIVSYISSDPSIAAIIGTKVHILTAGTVNITALQAGNLIYDAAPNIVRSLTINKAQQLISFSEIGFKNYNAPDFTLSATSSVNLPIIYKSANTNIATVTGDKVHIITEGSVLITAMQVGNINYSPAEVSRELIVGYSLPASNFRVQSSDETCKTSNNGSITITAVQALSYTAVITGGSKNSTQNFSTSLQLSGLEAGIYSICITVAGSSSYKQCFDVLIKEPKDLMVYSTINKDGNTVLLKFEGSDFYTIEHNGEIITTAQQEIVLPLIKGNNLVKISTNKTCQGVIEKLFLTTNGILIYPNPVKDILNVNIGNIETRTIKVDIYALDGRVVYTSNENVENGKIILNLMPLPKGMYILKLTSRNETTIHKFIKE